MDSFDSQSSNGSLQISMDVIEKIARHAALEVEGVYSVVPAGGSAKTFIGKLAQGKAVKVELKNDVADIEISIKVKMDVKIPEISENVQKSIKDAVQNMTSISVARVDVVVVGIELNTEENC